jgi:signal peptidase I
LVTVAGCGSGDAGQVKESFARFVAALQGHDVTSACQEMTAAFWRAAADQVNAEDVGSGRPVSATHCRPGLTALVKLEGNRSLVRGPVSATHVVVHGDSATARETGPGSLTTPIRFVRVHGRWRVDCCTGRQLERQAEAQYRIPSGSMLPTLHLGQIIVSDNAVLHTRPPGLGEIVVFHPPAGADSVDSQCAAPRQGGGFPQPCGRATARESGQTFIKRVVGLPGDRIALVDGVVIRNGKPEPRMYKVEPCGHDKGCNFPQPIVVPAGQYYVLGDNLPASDDSRFWGPVKRSWLIGVVKLGQ